MLAGLAMRSSATPSALQTETEKSTTERQLATIQTRVLSSESQTLAPATMQPMQLQTSGGRLGVRDQNKHVCTELE